jgi:O-antigen/teichoic acid export membrane protein
MSNRSEDQTSSDKNVGAGLFGNTSILIATRVLTKAIGTVFTIVVARKLGIEDYGLYVFANSLGGMFGMAAVFGLPRLITRVVAREMDRTGETLANIIILESALLTLAVTGMVSTILLLGYSGHRLWIVIIGGSGALLVALLDINAAFFRAHRRMDLEALMRIPLSSLNLILGVAVLLAGLGILGLVVVQWIIYAFILVSGFILAMRKLGRPSFSLDLPAYRTLLTRAFPFALSTVFVHVYQSVAMILLPILGGDEITGLYAGAKNFLAVFGVLPISLTGSFFPVMSQLWETSYDDWRFTCQRSLKYLLIMALPIVVGLSMIGEQVTLLVLGDEFAESGLILQTMAFWIILAFLNAGLSNALLSVDREKTHMRIVGVLMVVNVGANLALIPFWGAYGAVAASLLTEGLMLLTQSYVLSKVSQGLFSRAITLQPILSVIVMAGAVYLARGLGLVPTVVVGAVVYPLSLFALGAFDANEIGLIRSLWTARPQKLRRNTQA